MMAAPTAGADPASCVAIGPDMGGRSNAQAGFICGDKRRQDGTARGSGPFGNRDCSWRQHGIWLELRAEMRVFHLAVIGKGAVREGCLRAVRFEIGAPNDGLRFGRHVLEVADDHPTEIRRCSIKAVAYTVEKMNFLLLYDVVGNVGIVEPAHKLGERGATV
jgi:hypothetical protein